MTGENDLTIIGMTRENDLTIKGFRATLTESLKEEYALARLGNPTQTNF